MVLRFDYKRLLMIGSYLLSIIYGTTVHAKSLDAIEALRCIRDNNPTTEIADALILAAKSQQLKAKSADWPSLRIDGMIAPLPARRLLQQCASPTPGPNGLLQVAPCPNQQIQDDQRISDLNGMGIFYRTQATVTQPLFTFGKGSAGKAAAAYGVAAYQTAKETATHSLDELALQAFYGALLGKSAQKMFKKAHSRVKKFKARIQKDIDQDLGKYDGNDLRSLQIQEVELKSRELEVLVRQDQALKGLQIGCKLGQKPEILGRKLKPLPYVIQPYQSYQDALLSQHPLLKSAQQALSARQAEALLAQRRYYPDLALIGAFTFARGTSAEDNPDPFANDPFNVLGYGAFLGLSWRLDFASLYADLKRTQANVNRASAEIKALKQSLELKLYERYTEVKRLEQEVDLRKKATRWAKQSLSSSYLNVETGLIQASTLKNQLTDHFTSTLKYLQAIFEYNIGVVRLWLAVGYDPLERFITQQGETK